MFISSARLLEIDISNILCTAVYREALFKFQGSPAGAVEGLEASRGKLLQRVKPKRRKRKKP